MKITTALLGALPLAICPIAQGAPMSGNDGLESGNVFFDVCTNASPSMNTACVAYVKGLMEGMEIGQYAAQTEAGLKAARVIWCRPDTLTPVQTRDVLLKYLRDNPEHRDLGTSLLAYEAWHEAWPCPK